MLKRVNETPADRWGQYYRYSWEETASGVVYSNIDYDGPFGTFSLSENVTPYNDDFVDRRDFDIVKRQEADADTLVTIRRQALIKSIASYIALHTAGQSSTGKDVLLAFLKNGSEPKDVRIAAKRNLQARGLISEAEAFQHEYKIASPEEKPRIVESWPAHLPFLPDRYVPIFPLGHSGYKSIVLSKVKDRDDLGVALRKIDEYTRQQAGRGCLDYDRVYYSLLDSNGRELAHDLILASHQFKSFGLCGTSGMPTAQQILTFFRAPGALAAIENKEKHDYHDLAFLYNALRFGDSTLGAGKNSRTIANALRRLKARAVSEPKILVLGFSSIYSLENIGAILSLVGFKNASLVALDISSSPLEKARTHFGQTIFGFPIEYVKGDALSLPFDSESFDLVATHLFMTHIADQHKDRVVAEAERVLKPGRELIDEEIVVPPETDRERYKWFYATLADYFPGTAEQKTRVEKYMVEIGSYPVFYPYVSKNSLAANFNRHGLEAHLGDKDDRPLYAGIYADLYQIIARKI
ncbi:MAG: methyltransferase domain-containing protein [Candidatus Margulisiibacteriota bacterium]